MRKVQQKLFVLWEFKEENNWASLGFYYDAGATALGKVVLKEGDASLNNDKGENQLSVTILCLRK